MESYLSNAAAAAFWRIPQAEAILAANASARGIRETDNNTLSKRRTSGGSTLSVRDITADSHSQRTKICGKQIRSCELPLPRGAIVRRGGVRIASPELVFLQLARELSVQQLILLGLQMCSHAPMQANKALTTRRKLELFLAKTEGHRGHRKAARAVQYLANGSNSIMESFTYMFLTLPSALGGFGLKGATFNHEVTLNAESRRSLLQRSVFTDLYYEKAKVAVEYQSLAHHQGEGRKGHDTLRITALALHGIEVFQLSPYQIFSESDLKGFARTLASRLGMRIRERSEKFEQMHRQLHGLLESVARRPSEALPVRAGAVIR